MSDIFKDLFSIPELNENSKKDDTSLFEELNLVAISENEKNKSKQDNKFKAVAEELKNFFDKIDVLKEDTENKKEVKNKDLFVESINELINTLGQIEILNQKENIVEVKNQNIKSNKKDANIYSQAKLPFFSDKIKVEDIKIEEKDVLHSIKNQAKLIREQLITNPGVVTLDELNKQFNKFRSIVNLQLQSIGGGGSTKIDEMDDVDYTTKSDGFALKWNSSKNKYEFGAVAVSFAAIDENLIPDADATRDIGSSSKKWNNAYFKNLTVDGTLTTIETTNTVVSDQLFELGNGRTGTPSGDAGIVIERGDSNNAFIGFDESADQFVVGTGTFTGSSSGDLTITASKLTIADPSASSDAATKNYVDTQISGISTDVSADTTPQLGGNLDLNSNDITGVGNINTTGDLDISGTSTLSGNVTLGTVDGGDSSLTTLIVNGRIASDLIPAQDGVYNLGRANQRWKTAYISANTLDIGGALISSDGSGTITLSAAGAVLPTGTKLGANTIATTNASGIATRAVPLYTQTSGLGSPATTFTMAASSSRTSVFTSFTKASGAAQDKFELFSF